MEFLDRLDVVERYAEVSVHRTFRDRTSPYDNLSDEEFRKDYRFSKHVFFDICSMMQDELQRRQGRGIDLTVADQVAISIHLLGRNVMQSDSARIAGCHQSTVSRVLFTFVRALNRRAARYIHWPTEVEKARIRQQFYRRFGVPGVTGVIDGTHCRIQRPTEGEEDYVNRKGYHSLNVGVVVDYDLKVRWVNSMWPGSAHDSRVFTTSALYDQLRRGELQGTLLGDSAYRAETFLLKPLDNPSTRQEQRHNRAVCAARAKVEQAFGVLKRQFHILHGECRYSPEKAAQIVVACCVLRNIAIDAREPIDYDEYTGEDRQDGEVPSEPSTEMTHRSATAFMRDIIA
ncbi:transposase, IS4 family, partial [Ostertagia ostertagi]